MHVALRCYRVPVMNGDYQTLGRIAERTGAPYRELRKAAEQTPATFSLNGLGYYGPEAQRRMLEMIDTKRPAAIEPAIA